MTGAIQTPVPSQGCRRPRAQGHRHSARSLDLSGRWRFRLSPTATCPPPPHDVGGWDEIDVPGHWVLQGYGDPLYTNTAYPFPIDPPRVPDDNPTGDHVRTFELPPDWRREGTTLLLQGADSAARVWLNGVEAGWTTGSRLPAELDVGALLRDGVNTVAIRVYRWSAGSYLEDQDMWWLPGLFRPVLLLEGRTVDDVAVHAGFDHRTGEGLLRVDATAVDGSALPGVADLPGLDLRGLATGVEHRIPAVAPWSAESPALHDVVVRAAGEQVELRVGFRSVAVVDGVLEVNGRPLRMRGVNRHEHHAERGRALTRDDMLADVLLMKRHHVDAVRTAHYPPHPDFLSLCDEHGLWVVEECDIETHGFVYAGWEGNPPADPAWTPALLERTARMVERDKNHPSIIMWSLANESEAGEGFDAVAAWLRARDPGRPLHYERDRSYRNSDVYGLMYPSLEELAAIGRREEPTPAVLADDPDGERRRRALPFLLCEYAHAMGNGPGSLADYEEVLAASDRCCGAFVWEWIDHGLTGTGPDGRAVVRHGGDVDHRPNGGRYCLDGLLFADRTPSPGLAEYAAVNAPVVIEASGEVVTVRSRYRDVSTAHLAFTWELAQDGVEVAAGDLDVPELPPGGVTRVPLPRHPAPPGPGEVWLTVTARQRAAVAWAPAGHVVARGQAARPTAPRPAARAAALSPRRGAGTVVVGPAVLDGDGGALLHLGGIPVAGPHLEVWRAPIENDHGQGPRHDEVSVWRAVGLDRMLRRVDGVDVDSGDVLVRERWAPAAQPFALLAELRWRAVADDAVALSVDVTFSGPWHSTPYGSHRVRLPRLGLRLALPGAYRTLTWFGLGPGAAYRDSRAATRVGRWRRAIDELATPYPFPQENGTRHEVRWAELSAPGLPTLRVDADGLLDVSARRCTSADLDAAARPSALPDTGFVHLCLDHGQRGLGSASCGPALPERYEIPLEPTRFGAVLAARP